MRLLTKIAGPRVLLGVLIAAGLAISFLWWQLSGAHEDLGQARQQASELRQALSDADGEVQRLLAERNRLAETLVARAERHEQDRRALRRAEDALEKLEAEQAAVREWSAGRVPQPVRCWVRDDTGAGGQDEGGPGESAGCALSELPDASVPDGDER